MHLISLDHIGRDSNLRLWLIEVTRLVQQQFDRNCDVIVIRRNGRPEVVKIVGPFVQLLDKDRLRGLQEVSVADEARLAIELYRDPRREIVRQLVGLELA